jgi:DNA-binding LacI/PurR family transcriptional regulator
MRDVAQALGVHISTVSLVMRHHPSIPEATKRRVEAQAAKMGYKPDPMLRSLLAYSAKNRTERSSSTIALVVLHLQFAAWGSARSGQRYLEGIKRQAERLGHEVEIFCPTELAKEEKDLHQILLARGIRGVILVSPVHETTSHVLDWSHYATVKVGYAMQVPRVHRVLHHFRFAVKDAISELRKRGYRKFGLAYSQEHEERLEDGWTGGFLIEQHKAQEGEGFFFYRQYFPTGISYFAAESARFKEWFEQHKPEVVLSAMGWAPAFLWRDMNLRMPEDVGFVDLAWPVYRETFAGIDERLEEVGAAAVDMVSAMLHNNEYGIPAVPKTITLEGSWVEGNSVRGAGGEEE